MSKRKATRKVRPRTVKREPTKKLAAKLTPEELDQLLQAEDIIETARLYHALMARGYQSLWVELRQKYSIVGVVDLDKKTGEVFQKPGTTLEKVH